MASCWSCTNCAAERCLVPPSSVDVTNVTGVDHQYANLQFVSHGGSNDGKTTRYTLIYTDGKWKVAAGSTG